MLVCALGLLGLLGLCWLVWVVGIVGCLFGSALVCFLAVLGVASLRAGWVLCLVVCYLLLVMVAGLWLGCCDYVWLLLWGGGGFRYLGAVLFVVIC